MDAVELGRRRAAELHIAAVARGLDPAEPYLFVCGEASHRGLDVEKTVPGAAVLDNGRATLVEDLIIHENIGSVFEQAFLVAHEIGHHELGDAATNPTVADFDVTRPSEPSPTGADRVVDYGRRQRREVQMDLFAREFFLPRPLMRRLHLDEGLSADEIANRMKAPFDAVAQQLLDALLLPIVETQEVHHAEKPLNDEQKAAAAHRGVPYLLEAGPGTGKTQTLTARVVQLLDDGVDPRRILVLTYSNKAAGEMAERIARKRPDGAAAMWVGTFHAFGLDLIRRLSSEFDLPDNPRMMDRVEAVELLENQFPKLDLDHYQELYDPTRIIGDILSAVSRAKDEVVGPEEYERHALDMLTAAGTDAIRRTRAEEALEVARVYKAYEALKRQRHAIDFGDLVSMPVKLLESRSDLAAQMQLLYDHVLVDEYQDVNRASIRLLKALVPGGTNLWVVGDARQSIYRFRGASPISTTNFTALDFPGAKSSRLKINYRSTDEIVTAYSTFAQDMSASRTDSALQASRGASGHPLELRSLAGKPMVSVAIADAVAEMQKSGVAYRDQAVLCTGNERLGEIARDLERLDIPVLFLGSLFERGEVKDLLSLLSLLSDRRAMGLARVGCMPEFAMTLGDVGAIFEELKYDEREPMAWLADRASLSISQPGRAGLDHLSGALKGFDASSSPWLVLAVFLLNRSRIAARIGSTESIAVRNQGIALWQLLNFLRVQPRDAGEAVPRLLERIRRLVAIGDDRDLRQLPAAAQGLDAVRLMTIHGAKGLEFKCVHVPGLNQDTLPGVAKAPECLPPDGVLSGVTDDVQTSLKAGDAEERDCLFYVAASRARDRLFFYAVTHTNGGATRPLSTYLSRLGSGLVRLSPVMSRALPPEPVSSPVSLVIDGAMNFRASQIAMLEATKCKRRFFYTHVLKIGGKRTETPYMRMHEAARSVVYAVIQNEVSLTTDSEIRAVVERACDEQGLDSLGAHAELRAAAFKMVSFFCRSRIPHTPVAVSALPVSVGQDAITFNADDVLTDASGRTLLRCVRTGAFRESDTKNLGVAIALLAVADNSPAAQAEVIHLTSRTVTPLSLTARVLGNRRETLQTVIREIRAGHFPATKRQRVCPRCPAFFVCGPVPDGDLFRKF